ncbi:MAG: DUF2807 domain-containing protein [Flavobacteriales bacterium]|nr:DUF2807 domain-containing protein [Flavobacteriales bacterium]MCW8912178.1 DUF2807 domain-containing protein [Flavobacteriales bacterium]MCW8938013.1 DUF2807 domain-containing protein [Flavobacteriales bacterium]MCW8940726.1 DUF2807 domain-containing protein [Flavobacteriales bacterium]MCW8967268.1 DUF2807 domain-containing protein [Flavobacteriales bacterium]
MQLVLKYRIFFFAIIMIVLNACKKESACIKSTGKQVVETRIIGNDITHIILKDKLNLVLRQDSIVSLTIEGGENLLKYVRARQKGTELELKNDNKCNFLRSYKEEITVYLTLPNIKYINYTGFGNVSSLGELKLNEFTFETRNGTGSINLTVDAEKISILQHTGPADFTLNGKANFTYLFSGGSGWLTCKNLISKNAHVNHDGTGNVILTATNSLLIELTSIGNIEYYGNPSVTISQHAGRGKLIKK